VGVRARWRFPRSHRKGAYHWDGRTAQKGLYTFRAYTLKLRSLPWGYLSCRGGTGLGRQGEGDRHGGSWTEEPVPGPGGPGKWPGKKAKSREPQGRGAGGP